MRFIPSRFLNRLHAPPDAAEAHRAERVLAAARVFLAVCSLAAIYFDPTEPTRYARLAYVSLIIYVIHSFAIVAILRSRREVTAGFSLVLHGADVFWPAYISLFTEGPNSPFFLFFIFVLLAAAYRWGLRESLVTAGVAIVLLAAEAFLLGYGPGQARRFLEGHVELNRLIIRATYLLIIGFLVGYLAEEEKQLRSASAAITRVIGKAQFEIGLRRTMQALLEEFLGIFDSRQALLGFQAIGSGETYLWEVRRVSGGPARTTVRLSEVSSDQRGTYFFPFSALAGHVLLSPSGKPRDWLTLTKGEAWQRGAAEILPKLFVEAHPASHALLIVPFRFRELWDGRLFLLDPHLGISRKEELWFAYSLLQRLLPAVYNVYLLRRLRSQAGAIERARVARELHDGIMQSLSAAVMKVGLLRRQLADATPAVSEELGQVQEILREEVISLRELMQQMRPLDLAPQQLLDYVADLVERFHRETGINARFISDLEEIPLRPRVCRELARIVQEALVNIRRHSGAQNVMVRFTSQDGSWKLVVDDDGRGFPFAGRLTHSELDAARKGPLVIKERVRSIGGELTVDSLPGRGARLEVTIAEKGAV